MLHLSARILHFDIGHRVCAAVVADQQRVAIGEVARVGCPAVDRDLAAIGVVRMAGRNALGDDAARRVLAEVDHLGAAIDLLVAVRDRDRIELAARVVAAQDAGRIFPGDRRAGLDLRPRDLGAVAAAVAALGDEIVDAALAVLVAGIPVLDGGILDLGVIERHQFDHGRVQLVLVALRRGAAFEVRHVGALLGDDQRALELAGILLVDAEIRRQFHRAAHALGDEHEGSVGEDGRIQRRVVIVCRRHDRAEIFPDDLRVFADRLRHRHEQHAGLGELGPEGGDHGDGIEHRVDRDAAGLVDVVARLAILGRLLHAGEDLLLLQRNSELLIDLENFGVDVAERGRAGRALRRGVVVDVLEIDLRIVDARPGRLLEGQPAAIGAEAPFKHPVGLALLGRNEADRILGQALRCLVHLDKGFESVFVLIHIDVADLLDGLLHSRHQRSPSMSGSRPDRFQTWRRRWGTRLI